MSLLTFVREFAPPATEAKPSTIARLGLSDHAVHKELIYERKKGPNGLAAVEDSEDLQRILALPRRPVPSIELQKEMARVMTLRLRYERTTPCDCAALNPTAKARGLSPCITTLRPVQGWYLTEAELVGGALGFIPVGGGKTPIDALLPMVLPNCKTYVLMIPPSLVDQFRRDFRLISQHFRTPNLAGSNGPFDPARPTLRVLKYSELSRANFATWLKAMRPDALGFDEAQSLKDPESVRTDRLLRYFEETDGVDGMVIRSFFHSGSLTTRGLQDYSHLSALALREGSPVPLQPATVQRWGAALNPAVGRAPAPMGALRYLCESGEKVRRGFRRRLKETLGVITVEGGQLEGVALRIHTRDPGPLPEIIEGALSMPRQRSKRPDGEELVEYKDVVKVCRQLSSGFFYRWRYPHVYGPNGDEVESDEGRARVIDEWFSRRQDWARELRGLLEKRSDLLDSPELITNAALRALEGYAGDLPTVRTRSLSAWLEYEDRVEYETETQWIDDFLVKDSMAWLREAPGVAYYWHSAFGEALAERTGLPWYKSKNDVRNLNPTPEMLRRRDALIAIGEWKDTAGDWLGVEDGSRSIICGIKPFHFGVNLQSFTRMLVCNSPSDGGIWEQLLGRLYREGQTAKVVDVWVYRHTPEVAAAIEDAKEYARYTFETTGKAERLLFAEYVS